MFRKPSVSAVRRRSVNSIVSEKLLTLLIQGLKRCSHFQQEQKSGPLPTSLTCATASTALPQMCRPRRKMSGHIFIFRGHSDSQVKLLWSTSDGLCILTIRLEGIDWRYPSAKTAHCRTGDTETLSAGKTGRPGAGNRPSAGATGQASSDELRPLFRRGIPPYHTNGNRSEPGAEKNAHLIGQVDNQAVQRTQIFLCYHPPAGKTRLHKIWCHRTGSRTFSAHRVGIAGLALLARELISKYVAVPPVKNIQSETRQIAAYPYFERTLHVSV